jgi:hypothetical protein
MGRPNGSHKEFRRAASVAKSHQSMRERRNE